MPLLNCMVTNCVYNKEELCSRGDIKISGRKAIIAEETCCDSFRDKNHGAAKNAVSTECGCSSIHVDCDACACKYNEDKNCCAAEIQIDGSCAEGCDDTVCETFCRKPHTM